jgi:hypothetical protein
LNATPMAAPTQASAFTFGQVPSIPGQPAVVAAASLGPLAAFTGTFTGTGFNIIFRPDSTKTPTPLPKPTTNDNVLELNLTSETLAFSPALGSVPNRGSGSQGDIFLNGVPYLQTINDVTNPAKPVGIHFEPGLWMAVPATTAPAEKASVVRMASIPHGTTIEAQGSSAVLTGKPDIPAVDITPFVIGSPNNKIPFPSQNVTNNATTRIPQDLTSFVKAGTITQAMLNDPNSLLRNHIASQTIKSTTRLSVFTGAPPPLTGGGTDNITFLQGTTSSGPNAQAIRMHATFWIETVEFTAQVPALEQGQSLVVPATVAPGQPAPAFLVRPPVPVTAPRQVTVTATQIQYSQQVFLNFNGLTWPHVSVATLVPSGHLEVPASAWT